MQSRRPRWRLYCAERFLAKKEALACLRCGPVGVKEWSEMNTLKSTFLLGLLTLILLFVGEHFGGRNGMVIAFLFSVIFNFGTYFFSDKLALAMYRAQPVTREQLPRVYEVVERLSAKQGLPMPKIYVIPSESPNAFATGRNPNQRLRLR